MSVIHQWSCSVMSDCDPMDCNLPGSSVHGIFQARILDCVAISFSRGSSCPGDWTQDSCIAGGFFTQWATKEVLSLENNLIAMHIKCPWYVAFWDSRYWVFSGCLLKTAWNSWTLWGHFLFLLIDQLSEWEKKREKHENRNSITSFPGSHSFQCGVYEAALRSWCSLEERTVASAADIIAAVLAQPFTSRPQVC